MKKSIYLALIGTAVAQKTPFTKFRNDRLHRRKLEHEEVAWDEAAWAMEEPMEWDETAWAMEEPMDWEYEDWGDEDWVDFQEEEWETWEDPMYQEFYLSPMGADLSDYFNTYPSMNVYSDVIDVSAEPPTATYHLYIVNDASWMNYEYCYLSATIDPETFAPIKGLTVVAGEGYECSLTDFVPYTASDTPDSSGAVKIKDTYYDLFSWDVMDSYYETWEEAYCDENWDECYGDGYEYPEEDWEYEDWDEKDWDKEDWDKEDWDKEDWDKEDWDVEDWKEEDWEDWEEIDWEEWEKEWEMEMEAWGDDWEDKYWDEWEDEMEDWADNWEDDYWEDDWMYYDYDYGMDYYGYSDYDYSYGYDMWDYYGYGETYYYMYADGPQEEKGIMEQIQGWFSGDASNNMLTAIASVLTIAAMQI